MIRYFNELLEVIGAWLFTPPKSKQTYCCRDVGKDEQEEEKPRKGGFAN